MQAVAWRGAVAHDGDARVRGAVQGELVERHVRERTQCARVALRTEDGQDDGLKWRSVLGWVSEARQERAALSYCSTKWNRKHEGRKTCVRPGRCLGTGRGEAGGVVARLHEVDQVRLAVDVLDGAVRGQDGQAVVDPRAHPQAAELDGAADGRRTGRGGASRGRGRGDMLRPVRDEGGGAHAAGHAAGDGRLQERGGYGAVEHGEAVPMAGSSAQLAAQEAVLREMRVTMARRAGPGIVSEGSEQAEGSFLDDVFHRAFSARGLRRVWQSPQQDDKFVPG